MADLSVSRSRERYRESTTLLAGWPLWHQPWWLDAVAGTRGWDVLVAESGDDLAAALPFTETRLLRRPLWGQPPLTQALGPVLAPLSGSYQRRVSREAALLAALAAAIPDGITYRQSWTPSRTNWLPFHWAGFRQTTRYTLQVDTRRSMVDVLAGASSACRGAARKAQSRMGVKVLGLDSLDEFLRLNANVFLRKGMERPFDAEIVRRIHRAGSDRGQVELRQAVDGEGNIHAAGFFAWDSQTCYYLLGGTDPAKRDSGAMNLLIFDAIERTAERGLTTFDFEGSMIEPIEFFFRSFGSRQVPYMSVTGPKNTMLSRVLSLRG